MGEGASPPPPAASPFVPQPPAAGAPSQGPAPVQGQPMGPPPMVYQQPPPVVINAPPTVAAAGGYAGYRVLPPRIPPQPGQVIVGWEISDGEAGCCACETLSSGGWVIVIILAIFFWPACFIVCMMNDCHDRVQRPVYGWPGQNPYAAYQGAAPPSSQMPPQYQAAPPQGPSYYQAAPPLGPPQYQQQPVAQVPPPVAVP